MDNDQQERAEAVMRARQCLEEFYDDFIIVATYRGDRGNQPLHMAKGGNHYALLGLLQVSSTCLQGMLDFGDNI